MCIPAAALAPKPGMLIVAQLAEPVGPANKTRFPPGSPSLAPLQCSLPTIRPPDLAAATSQLISCGARSRLVLGSAALGHAAVF
jgi:hypothetical protein